jgi:hypothetical protein
MNHKYKALLAAAVMAFGTAQAGNPDRQGEAGANQLLINPWARSAGFHSMNTSNVMGAEAMYLNVAGLARINKTQIQLANTQYLVGADMRINALALGQRVGKSGAFGLNLVAFDLGEFKTTTVNTPEGSESTFSPSFFNMGISYSQVFANKVSVGVTAKFVNEAITNARASAVALDAGVQYVTGPNDNFKFGISLRNVGSKMTYRGEGLSTPRESGNDTYDYLVTYYQRSSAYELPSQLNIGASYDWLLGNKERGNRFTVVGNFTSNAFSRDQVGGGIEFALGQLFALRAAYKMEFDAPVGSVEATLDNGFSGGVTVAFPVKKGSDTRIVLDYGYRFTEVYDGIHNIGLRIDL